MARLDARMDAYIAKSGAFAQPILTHLRRIVHAAHPDVEEAFKWSFPHFLHKGILCSMAAFKEHCTFGFWKGALIFGQRQAAASPEEEAMGQFGRITTLADLPPEDVLIGYVKEAVRLNDAGIKLPPRAKLAATRELVVPDYFIAALKGSPKALTAFENFSYSHRKEYVEWITEAKTEVTRQKRLATSLEWLAEGKSRNRRYQNC